MAFFHPIAHLHVHRQDLALRPGIQQSRLAGKDQHALAFDLSWHGPKQGPQRQHPGDPSKANAYLAVITQASPTRFELFGFGLTAIEQLREETLRHGV